MSGHRQAAVALYALDAQDQRSILAELPEPDQDILRGLLAELAELGFEPAAAIAEAVPVTPPAAVPAPSDAAAELREVLRRASPAAMVAALGHEPASLQACFLALERWPWTGDFLALLPPPRRALVGERLRAGVAAAPARALFLLESVAAQLPTAPAGAARGPGGWLSRSLHKLAPWTR